MGYLGPFTGLWWVNVAAGYYSDHENSFYTLITYNGNKLYDCVNENIIDSSSKWQPGCQSVEKLFQPFLDI